MFDNIIVYVVAFPWLGYSIATIAGLIFGSFLTFLVYRVKNNEPWLWGRGAARSKCPLCGATLQAIDLIPILSWLMMRGRCRHCASPISSRYLVFEITSAIIFIFAIFWWLYRD